MISITYHVLLPEGSLDESGCLRGKRRKERGGMREGNSHVCLSGKGCVSSHSAYS